MLGYQEQHKADKGKQAGWRKPIVVPSLREGFDLLSGLKRRMWYSISMKLAYLSVVFLLAVFPTGGEGEGIESKIAAGTEALKSGKRPLAEALFEDAIFLGAEGCAWISASRGTPA